MCTLRGRRTFCCKGKLEVADDFVYEGLVLDEGDDLHLALALGTDKSIDFIDLVDHLGPSKSN